MARSWTASSATRLVAPMIDVGRTALSVEIMTNASTPCSPASSPSRRVREDVVLDRLARVRLHHRARACAPPRGTRSGAHAPRRAPACGPRRRRRPRAAATSTSGRVRRSSPSISKSANSARSTSRIFAGCETSDLPRRARSRWSPRPRSPSRAFPRGTGRAAPRRGTPARARAGPRSGRCGCA